MSEEAPWIPLNEAATRCERSYIWSDPLEDILRSGRVPVRGKRSGYAADPIENLLRRVSHPPAPRDPLDRIAAIGLASSVSFWSALNQITLRPDARLLREDRQLAAELGDQFAGQIPGILPSSVTFTDVVVHWPKLVDELQAAGFKIKAQRQRPARWPSVAETTPATASALPRPMVHDDVLRAWYVKRVQKGRPTSEAADWNAAQHKFGLRVRRDKVRSLRHELAPEAWRKQGRRRKAAENSAK